MPEIIKINPQTTNPADLRPVVDVLLRGGLVAGPTETFYGLMAAADNRPALERVVRLKGRDGRKPLLLLLDQTERALCYGREIPDSARGLVGKFWPGPLTLLLMARPGLPEPLVGPARTVGVRVEGLPMVRWLVRCLDRAVTGTSANPGGLKPARTVEEVLHYFRDDLDLVIDSGPCPGGQPSTMVDVSLGRPRLIRDGPLSMNAMMAAAPDMRT